MQRWAVGGLRTWLYIGREPNRSLSHKETDPNAPPIDLRTSYVSYAGIGAIVWWLEQDQPCTPEQLAVWLGQLSTASAGLSFKPNLKPAVARHDT
jgi:hypothetical protein